MWTSSTATAARSSPSVSGGRRAGREEHEQRAQALAPGGDHVTGVALQHGTVAGGRLCETELELVHQTRGRRTAGLHNGLYRADRAHPVTSPTCSAMIPPAVST